MNCCWVMLEIDSIPLGCFDFGDEAFDLVVLLFALIYAKRAMFFYLYFCQAKSPLSGLRLCALAFEY